MENIQHLWADLQQFIVGVGFVMLGFFFRAYLEKNGALHRKLSADDWFRIFNASGINNEAVDRWHEQLRKQQPKLFDTLSKRIRF